MKRIITQISMAALLLGTSFIASAQTEAGGKILLNSAKSLPALKTGTNGAAISKTMVCGTDTIVYPYLKELAVSAPADSFFVDAMVGNVRTAAQGYPLNGTVNVKGIQFWGAAYSTSPAPQTLVAVAYLYAVDGFFMPTAVLDSTLITITQNYDFYEGTFAMPYTITGNFAVGVRSLISDTLAVITNNAGAVWQSPAYNEALAWRRFGSGTWNQTLAFFGQDLEYMVFPIVDYSITSSFTSSATSVCPGSTVNFTNTSSSLFDNRAFNLYSFDEYFGFSAADSSFSWNYGTDPSWTNSLNGSKTYPSSGTFTTSLSAEMIGYYTTCADTMTAVITVNPEYTVSASTTICDGSTLTFGTQTLSASGVYTEPFTTVNGCDSIVTLTLTVQTVNTGVTATGATLMADAAGAGYQWIDCGTGTAIAGETNQSYTATAVGSYAVLVTMGLCSDTSSCVPVTTVGIDQNSASAATSVYPNPTSGSFRIQSAAIAERIVVYNVLGEAIMDFIPSAAQVEISLEKQSPGVYFVSVMNGKNTEVIKLIRK